MKLDYKPVSHEMGWFLFRKYHRHLLGLLTITMVLLFSRPYAVQTSETHTLATLNTTPVLQTNLSNINDTSSKYPAFFLSHYATKTNKQSITKAPVFSKNALKKNKHHATEFAVSKGHVRHSLLATNKRNAVDPKIFKQVMEIFGKQIDLSTVKPNDTFKVLYEKKHSHNNRKSPQTPPVILAAEIINGGKKLQAIRYTDKSGKVAYLTPDGSGLHQTFLRKPISKFAKISSHFGMRAHPFHNRIHHHKGVDYSAPKGTPVQATGDGKIIFIGNRPGYGNVVELQHGSRYTTLYAHLSRFPKQLKPGASVKQGQIIGFVGATGLATGSHLHYEFRINGIHHDPVKVSLPQKTTLASNHKRKFNSHAQQMLKLLDKS